jgi:hypothetical protein
MPETVLSPALIKKLGLERTIEVSRVEHDVKLGCSSSDLLTWALESSYSDVPLEYRGYHPCDSADLGRCELAYTAAPEWLRGGMLPVLTQFRQEQANREKAYEEHTALVTLLRQCDSNAQKATTSSDEARH